MSEGRIFLKRVKISAKRVFLCYLQKKVKDSEKFSANQGRISCQIPTKPAIMKNTIL